MFSDKNNMTSHLFVNMTGFCIIHDYVSIGNNYHSKDTNDNLTIFLYKNNNEKFKYFELINVFNIKNTNDILFNLVVFDSVTQNNTMTMECIIFDENEHFHSNFKQLKQQLKNNKILGEYNYMINDPNYLFPIKTLNIFLKI